MHSNHFLLEGHETIRVVSALHLVDYTRKMDKVANNSTHFSSNHPQNGCLMVLVLFLI
jgi:hypothetical protein